MIRLLTISSDAYLPLEKMTAPSKAKYAIKWGHYFHQDRHRGNDNIAWDRPARWLRNLAKCDWLFFTGTDVAITNEDIDITALLDPVADFIFSVSADQALQNDVWFMRNNDRSRAYLEQVLAWRDRGDCQNEQDAMQIVFSGCQSHGQMRTLIENGADIRELYNRSPLRCKILPSQWINALPENWKPGDFVLHMANQSLEYRLENFPKYL